MPSLHNDTACTVQELRRAFRLSGLWRRGWDFQRAIATRAVFIGLHATVRAMRARHQQQHGKPAPMQRALI